MGSRPGGQNGKVGTFGVAGGWCGASKTGAHEGRPYGGWVGWGARFFEGIGMTLGRRGWVPAPEGRTGRLARLGWQRGDVGRVRRAPTRDAPTGDGGRWGIRES